MNTGVFSLKKFNANNFLKITEKKKLKTKK